MKKVLIAIPCMDMVSARFAQSLATLHKVGECSVAMICGSLIYDSRNNLAKQAIELEADYIMWFDSDMGFEPDTMQRLMADLDEGRDIVSGLYFRRVHPFTPVLFETLELKEDGCIHKNYDDYPKDQVFEVAGCGFGCVLMKTDVLFDIAGADGGNWFTPIGSIGEDCAFCIRAREHGYKIYCDSRVKLAHMGTVPVTEGFYQNIRRNNA